MIGFDRDRAAGSRQRLRRHRNAPVEIGIGLKLCDRGTTRGHSSRSAAH